MIYTLTSMRAKGFQGSSSSSGVIVKTSVHLTESDVVKELLSRGFYDNALIAEILSGEIFFTGEDMFKLEKHEMSCVEVL